MPYQEILKEVTQLREEALDYGGLEYFGRGIPESAAKLLPQQSSYMEFAGGRDGTQRGKSAEVEAEGELGDPLEVARQKFREG